MHISRHVHTNVALAPDCLLLLLATVAAGSFGFDPLGLGQDPASLARFQESELIHCRWAMLGAAGVLGVEALGFGNWYDAPLWVSDAQHGSGQVHDMHVTMPQ